MKFTKFGKALLMCALSTGVIFGISSCVVSYTVGYLYVTGTDTAQPAGEGIISGYKIDHNTGQMSTISGLPVSSGGANPVRAVLYPGSLYLYVLNRGVNAQGNSDCTTTNPCQNANITEFAVGGNGILTPQQTFYTQGINPFRLALDPTGNYLLVLDHDAPDSNAYTGLSAKTNSCTEALGGTTTSCGDVTVFSVAPATGRLSLVENAQFSSAAGQSLTYFPVPAYPVDFSLNSNTLLTMSATANQTAYPYTGGAIMWPYAYNTSSGQLTLSLNSAQTLGITQGTALVNASSAFYVLDNEAPTPNPTGAVSQILPYTVGTNGALQPETSGVIPDDPTLANPIALLQESKQKFFYVANQGVNNTTTGNAQSGIAGYFLTTSPAYQATFIAGEPFGTGAGPQCIVEDPSDQYIYTANYNDSSITGRTLDVNSGVLDDLRNTNRYALPGPATWCLMNGRTN